MRKKKKKRKFVITLTSRFVAIDAHQCDECLPFDELYSKIIQFSKLSEAWVIFHGSKPEKKENKKKTNECGVTKSSGEATHNFIMMVGCEDFNSIISIHSKMCHHYL